MENKIEDFKTVQNMQQASNICAAAATFLGVALGEVCSLDAFNGSRYFTESEAKKIIPSFDKVLKILGKAHRRYAELAEELSNEKVSE